MVTARSRTEVIGTATPTVFAAGSTGTPRATPIAYGSKRMTCPEESSSSRPASA